MTRVVKAHDERKNELLDVAQNLFYQKGYSRLPPHCTCAGDTEAGARSCDRVLWLGHGPPP